MAAASRVLCIADIHAPFTHPRYREFCKDLKKKYRTNTTVFIGDVTDQHALSFHEHDPDGMSPGQEKIAAKKEVAAWYKAFPVAKVCIGNHDARTIRMARKAGLPMDEIKDFATTWGTPKWDWGWEHIIDNVLYTHGTGLSGVNAALRLGQARGRSTVIGHLHKNAGCLWTRSQDKRIFGLNVGCGIDLHSYAFDYGKFFTEKPMLGAGIIVDGIGQFIPMLCGAGEKYAR